jgi:PAS domain S-box-containing protein
MQDATDRRHLLSIGNRLFADQVHKQYEHTVSGCVATLINSVIVVLILWGEVSRAGLLIWLLFAWLVSACRLMLHRAYHKSIDPPANPEKWNTLFLVTLFLSGAVWGSSSVFMFLTDSIGHQAFIAFVVGGMAAGALSVFTAVRIAFFVFTLPALLPVCVAFFWLGDKMHMAMGVMFFIYWMIICLTAIRMHRNILDLLSVKYERTALIDSLREEIDQRKEAQEDLRRQKDQVEEIVTKRTAQLNSTNEELQRSKKQYQELVENINDVIYAIDRQGAIAYVSPVVETVLGYRAEELMGRSFFDFVYLQDIDRLKADFGKDADSTASQKDYRFIHKNGDPKWCRINARPISDVHNHIGFQGVLVDIDWSKRLEEQLQRAQKMEALGTLAGGVAHDLNNILSGIISMPELLLMDLPADSPMRRSLTIIQEAGENAAAVVQDLLTLARRGVPNYECLNVNQLIRRCLDSADIAGLLHHHSKIELTTRLQPDLLNIYGSSIHIFKTVSNLVINAVEAMPDGGRLEIATGNRYVDGDVAGFDTVEEGEYVVLSVSDTGVGIAENDQPKIFEPFYTKKVMGWSGSGLGMAVVWGAVKDHGGYIDLQSSIGEGARFDLFFPATRDQAQRIEKTEQLSEFMGNGEFIVVVDDIPAQRDIATQILNRLGYRSTPFSSGEEAIEFLRGNAADLIILDMILDPGMDGYETYRQICRIRPGQKAIIASGYSETERVKKTLALGAGKYIKKPYTLATIGEAVKAVLAIKEVDTRSVI